MKGKTQGTPCIVLHSLFFAFLRVVVVVVVVVVVLVVVVVILVVVVVVFVVVLVVLVVVWVILVVVVVLVVVLVVLVVVVVIFVVVLVVVVVVLSGVFPQAFPISARKKLVIFICGILILCVPCYDLIFSPYLPYTICIFLRSSNSWLESLFCYILTNTL